MRRRIIGTHLHSFVIDIKTKDSNINTNKMTTTTTMLMRMDYWLAHTYSSKIIRTKWSIGCDEMETQWNNIVTLWFSKDIDILVRRFIAHLRDASIHCSIYLSSRRSSSGFAVSSFFLSHFRFPFNISTAYYFMSCIWHLSFCHFRLHAFLSLHIYHSMDANASLWILSSWPTR